MDFDFDGLAFSRSSVQKGISIATFIECIS